MSCTTAVPRLAYMYANLTWWCHGPSLASTDLNRLHGLHAAKTSKHVWWWSMWRYLSLQMMWGGLSRELLHTRKLHRELPREHANHMISCELVNAIELWPNEPCTPQLMVEAIVKDHGVSDQRSHQNKEPGYNPEGESHKPRGLIHENCACKQIGMYENQNFECKTCMFSMKSIENIVNAIKSMVFQWKTWKNKYFQGFLWKSLRK